MSLCKLNPDHKIELYIPEETSPSSRWYSRQAQDFSNYSGRDYLSDLRFDNLEVIRIREDMGNGVQQCDWFKWRELSESGGWFSDMDIVYLKPLPEIDADVAITWHKHYSMGLMASSGNSDLFREVYERSLDRFDEASYQSTNQSAVYAVGRNIDVLRHRFKTRIFNIPWQWLYPYGYKNAEQYFIPGPISDEWVGLHWFAGTPVGQKFNNELVLENSVGGIVQDAARACF